MPGRPGCCRGLSGSSGPGQTLIAAWQNHVSGPAPQQPHGTALRPEPGSRLWAAAGYVHARQRSFPSTDTRSFLVPRGCLRRA